MVPAIPSIGLSLILLLGGADAPATPEVPWALVLVGAPADLVDRLQEEGLRPVEIREDIDLDVLMVEGSKPEPRRVDAGAVLIRTEGKAETVSRIAGVVDGKAELLRVPASAPIVAGGVRPPAKDRKKDQAVTFERLLSDPPRLAGSPVGGLRWMRDGKRFIQEKDGRPWKVEAATGRAEPLADPDRLAGALSRLPAIDAGTARSIAGRTRLHLSPAEDSFIFDHGSDLYRVALDGASAIRLTSSPQQEEMPEFSPDGKWVAFIRENDLWVVDGVTGAERALTSGGTDKVRNGKADWVYYEEIFDRNWAAFWWSPDARRIAFLRVDSRQVPEFTIADDLEGRQEVERTPYPKPGDPNPDAALGIVSVAGGPVAWADLSEYDPGCFLIVRVGFWPDGGTVWLMVQDRAQKWLDLLSLPAGGGKPRKLFREMHGGWVDIPPSPPAFLDDGSFILPSERTGFRHLYRFGRDGAVLGRITSGDWEVRSVEGLDPKGGWVYFSGTKDDPIAENLYRAKLDGSAAERLTGEEGSHRIDLAPGAETFFIDTGSSLRRPARVALRRVDGSLARTLDSNPVHALDGWRLGPVERLQVPARDGFLLEAVLVKPPDFDPSRRYPVWCSTYAGPRMPSVRDAWGDGRVWDHMLARAGIISFHVDPRSASGKGAVSAWTAHRKLGVQELADLEDAARWLAARPWVDPGRIGLNGVSYGGYITAFALTHSKAFSAGIAGAPVTDWRDYDSIYTEKYMDTPQSNPDGYRDSSVVRAASSLHGKLLLIHGAIDDNVHIQNTWRLVEGLVAADKDFELMVYPSSRHGFWSRHYRRIQYEFILKTMKPGARRI